MTWELKAEVIVNKEKSHLTICASFRSEKSCDQAVCWNLLIYVINYVGLNDLKAG